MKGFSLVELVVAMAITLVVTAATLALVGPVHDAFQVQPETADLQQRARVGIDALQRDLLMVGAGMYAAGIVGPLHHMLAPVLPYRAFGSGSDAARGTFFRSDAISLLFVPSTASQTTLSAPMLPGALDISLDASAATCPSATVMQVCGFAAGDQLLVFEREGAWDVFTVDQVGAGASLTLKGAPTLRGFSMAANVTEVRAVTYSLRADPTSGVFQIVRADGFDPAQPLLDHVVKLEFQYYGDPHPPRVLDEAEVPLRASYGPAPPPIEQPLIGWVAGENCTFARVDGSYQPRLAALASTALVEMTPALLTDGPWCPDATARNRFDADLLRIRRVGFSLRVQTAVESLRGPASALFTRGGLARAAGRYVPDLEIQLDVSPRNLNLERGSP